MELRTARWEMAKNNVEVAVPDRERTDQRVGVHAVLHERVDREDGILKTRIKAEVKRRE